MTPWDAIGWLIFAGLLLALVGAIVVVVYLTVTDRKLSRSARERENARTK